MGNLEGSGPGVIRSGWDQGAKREQGGDVQSYIRMLGLHLGVVNPFTYSQTISKRFVPKTWVQF